MSRLSRIPSPVAPERVVDLVRDDDHVVVPIANGEPVALLDALEDAGSSLRNVRVHQMHVLRDRRYLHGEVPGLHHVSYFLSGVTRPRYWEGTVSLVPAHFREVPALVRRARPSLVLATVSPPDEDGVVSLGTSADYVASLVGQVPFMVEVNPHMPRTAGANRLHLSSVAGWCEGGAPLVTEDPPQLGEVARTIAGYVAERIPDGAAVQAGIGAVPNAILASLCDHRDLTIHTELFGDGFADLVECGAATGARNPLRPGKAVTTFSLGSERLHRWLDGRTDVELHPVEEVNDPRTIGRIPGMTSINATTEVDLFGQCASETVAGRYWSGSGGQVDFARGAVFSDGGQAFVVVPSTAKGGEVSRIVARLTPGSIVTTHKNTTDTVVTEHGVAELRGRTMQERARALIDVAAPQFREGLERDAREQGLLRG